jgi:hypothetical protein
MRPPSPRPHPGPDAATRDFVISIIIPWLVSCKQEQGPQVQGSSLAICEKARNLVNRVYSKGMFFPSDTGVLIVWIGH